VSDATSDVGAVHGSLADGHGVGLRDDGHDGNNLTDGVHVDDIDVAEAVGRQAEDAKVDSRVLHLIAPSRYARKGDGSIAPSPSI